MSIKPFDLEKLVADTSNLPFSNTSVERVIELLRSPDTTAKDLQTVIESDKVLTEKLLKVVDSDFIGFSRDITSVMQSMVTLGYGKVKNLLISISILNPQKADDFPLDMNRFNEDIFNTAVAARLIVKHFEPQLENDAFMMGLLLNIGQLIFARNFPEEYSKIYEKANNIDGNVHELEKKNLLWDHSLAGAKLAQRWGYSEVVVTAIENHHNENPSDQPNSQAEVMVAAAYLAPLFYHVFRSVSKKEALDICMLESSRRLDLSEDLVHLILENMRNEGEETAKSFGFHYNFILDYTELLKILNIQLGEMNLTYEQMVRELRNAKAEAERLAHQLKIANTELKKRADNDGLTEIFNHRYFQEHLAVEFIRAQRHKNNLTLVMIDVDFFKKVNDEYGHVVGDFVLKEIASILKKNTRISDIAARYGGEEFVLLLPETNVDGAYLVAEKIRNIVENHPIRYESNNLTVKISAGIAAMENGKGFETAFDLIAAADSKLYKAKKSGRNQVVK